MVDTTKEKSVESTGTTRELNPRAVHSEPKYFTASRPSTARKSTRLFKTYVLTQSGRDHTSYS